MSKSSQTVGFQAAQPLARRLLAQGSWAWELLAAGCVGGALLSAASWGMGQGAPVWAQAEPLPPDLPDPTEETLPPPSPPPSLPLPPEDPILPSGPSPEAPVPPIPGAGELSFYVERIEVLGSTVLQAEIADRVAPLQGRELTLGDLLNLRTEITNLYVANGYVTSGAFVPNNQDLSDGVVQIQVVEGAIETVQINGLGRLRDYYVRDRISLATQAPLNVRRLEEALQLLQIDPLLERVNAELTAGSAPGRNVLILDLTEAAPFVTNFGVDNSRSASIGSVQGSAAATHLNLLGFGDRLGARYDYSEGLKLYELRYAVPLNALDGTFQVRYEEAESRIVDPQFVEAGIRNESETLAFSFRQPLSRSLASEFALGLSLDLRQSRSFILNDIPFSFSVGPNQGVARVSALRFSQEWVTRDINSVVAVRSQFSLGLDAFGATLNDTGTDARFFAWLGQFQWVEQFAPGNLLLTRVNAQLTPDSLLPLERFSLGGVDTVRGYAQNQIVTDNAVTASVEYRFPLTANPGELQLAPFIDAGAGWNSQFANPDPSFLLGTGLGLRWQPAPEFNVRLDYGIPLIAVRNRGGSLQENGFYFSVNLQPF